MKRMFFIFTVLFLGCISCNNDVILDDGKYCWTCVVEAKATVNGHTATNKQTVTICDKTEAEIREIEKSGTLATSGSGYTGKATTKCSQKGSNDNPERGKVDLKPEYKD
jgi:hypothetical protein